MSFQIIYEKFSSYLNFLKDKDEFSFIDPHLFEKELVLLNPFEEIDVVAKGQHFK
jgi:hypothetical protein